jgi:rSAM/selenodomain-associated transferase 2
MTMKVSIIIPVLNEASGIEQMLTALLALKLPAEVIVVDGGSDDGTIKQAQLPSVLVIEAPRGRARQMNAGAAVAQADYLLFLHADTRLPESTTQQLERVFKEQAAWGRFDVRVSGQAKMLAVVAHLMNWRSRLSGIATGDQAIFVKRELFEVLNGFADQPLMEDIELSKRLLAHARPLCLKGPALTSGRRWEQHGVWSTITLMWWLRWRYWRGESAEKLAKDYS